MRLGRLRDGFKPASKGRQSGGEPPLRRVFGRRNGTGRAAGTVSRESAAKSCRRQQFTAAGFPSPVNRGIPRRIGEPGGGWTRR